MGQPQTPVQELPDELAQRLHRLAETQTAGSLPWPGVDLALRRSHRRRVTGLSTLAAAGVLIIGGVLGGLLDPPPLHNEPNLPAVTTPPTVAATHPLTPKEAGLTGAVGGSLAGDGAWQEALRNRVVTVAQRADSKVSARDVLVLWAGDLNGARYAVVVFRQQLTSAQGTKVSWPTGILSGPAGAAASAMTLDSWGYSGAEPPGDADSEFLHAGKQAEYPGVVFVTAPKAIKAEVATSRQFGPGGKITTTWRSLQKQGGAVWVGQLSAAELYLFDTRITGMSGGGGSGQSVDTVSAAAAIALPGTDRAALTRASDAAHSLGASIEERPVLAASIPLGGPNTLAATVLRSPGGGYLFGMAEQYLKDAKEPSGAVVTASAISRQPFASAEAFMAAVMVSSSGRMTPKHPNDHYLVIAPAGADRIVMRGVSVPVHNRLAVMDVPELPYPYDAASTNVPASLTQIQALDAAGGVIGTVTPLENHPGHEAGEPGEPDVVAQPFGSYFGD
jgi:hypothetical protein